MKSFFAQLRSLVLPFGATSGQRIVLDGVNGEIDVYDVSGTLVGKLNADGFQINASGGAGSYIALRDGNVFCTIDMMPVGIGAVVNYLVGSLRVEDGSGVPDHTPNLVLTSPCVGTSLNPSHIQMVGSGITTLTSQIILDADVVTIRGSGPGVIIGGSEGSAAISSVGAESVAMGNAITQTPTFVPGRLYKLTAVVACYDNGAFPSLHHSEVHIYAGNTTAKRLASHDMLTCGGTFGVSAVIVAYVKNTTAAPITWASGPTVRIQLIAGGNTSTLQNWSCEIMDIGDVTAANLSAQAAVATAV